MIAHIKIFVLWLLFAALPLQGYAAVSAPHCGGARQKAAPAAVTPAHHAAAHADAKAAQRHRAAPCDKDAGSLSAGACHACCVGAVLLPSDANWQLPQARPGHPQAAADILFTGHIAAGLERPPRFS